MLTFGLHITRMRHPTVILTTQNVSNSSRENFKYFLGSCKKKLVIGPQMLGVDYFSLEILTKMAVDLQWEIMGNLLDFDFDQTDLQDEKLDSPRSKNMFEVKVSAS